MTSSPNSPCGRAQPPSSSGRHSCWKRGHSRFWQRYSFNVKAYTPCKVVTFRWPCRAICKRLPQIRQVVSNRSSVRCSVADGRARFRAIAHLLLNHTPPLVYHLHTRFATLVFFFSLPESRLFVYPFSLFEWH